jgi:hypothetical protein
MRRELVFLPEVSHDFAEGFNYYDAFSPGRGGVRFESAFRRALEPIEAGVITHIKAFEHFHRVFVPGFPYNLYYRLIENKAIIVGLLYSRFEPAKIAEILKTRL